MTIRLMPCARCARHVYAGEHECPFCGSALPPAKRRPAPPQPRGASRAAVFALRSALAAGWVGAFACAATNERPSADHAAGPGGAGDRSQADGGAAISVADADAALSMDATPFANPARRAAEPDAAELDGMADDEEDAGRVPVAIYGGVFPDPKSRAKV